MAASSSFYLKNATAGLLIIIPLLLAMIVLAAMQQSSQTNAGMLAGRVDSLEDTLQRLRDTLRSRDSAQRRLNQPPLIMLTEADGYTFEPGKADISPEFGAQLEHLVVARIAREALNCTCDVVEVIGHTDGQRVTERSNLDDSLGGAVLHRAELHAGSNADLGMMRAWSVIAWLRRDPALQGLTFYGYSAAQLIEPTGGYAPPGDHSDRPERRRIEIRLRRSRR